MNEPCTLWLRHNRDKHGKIIIEFNHLEDGHASTATPKIKHPAQEGWARATWSKRYAWLVDGVVCENIMISAP